MNDRPSNAKRSFLSHDDHNGGTKSFDRLRVFVPTKRRASLQPDSQQDGSDGPAGTKGSSSPPFQSLIPSTSDILRPTQPTRSQQHAPQATSRLAGQPAGKALADAEIRINNLDADLRREQKEHSRRKFRCQELDDENSALKENLQALQQKFDNCQRELQEAKSISDTHSGALSQAELRINNLDADLRREQKEHARRSARCHELENENTRLKENLQALHHELYNNQRELQETKSLSGTRSKTLSEAKPANSHVPEGPPDSRHGQSPSGHPTRDPDPSAYPKQKLVSSEEARRPASDSSGSSDLETMGPSAQINPLEIPLPPDFNQRARSHQQQQQQQQLQAAQQENSRFPYRRWRGATSFLGGQPKDRALEQAEIRINNLDADLRREQKEHNRRKARCYELEHENTRLKENLQALHHELYNNQRELQEAKSLSDIRGRELQATQVFLTKADSLSISDVIEKISILNEEIFQAAVLFAQGIRHQKYENIAMATIQEYQHQTCRALGERMTQLLVDQGKHSKANSEVHALISQSVISAYLVYFCNSKLNSWYPSEPGISEFLSQVYGQMRQHEEQAVSGRWRSLIRAQIRPSTDDWKKELFKTLDAMLAISSWGATTDVKLDFDGKVGPIFKALEDVRAAIYEKVTSVDLHAFMPEPDVPFEKWMEDAYGDNVDDTEIVAGTTAIGLKQTKAGREETHLCIIPPKVFLYSTLKDALQPPLPTKGTSRNM